MSQPVLPATTVAQAGMEPERVRVQLPAAARPAAGSDPTGPDIPVAANDGRQAPPPLTLAYARFSVDRETNIVSISIIDAATEEVIRQVPPEEAVELARIIQQQAKRSGRVNPLETVLPAGGHLINRTA